jgi:hypothetical protein
MYLPPIATGTVEEQSRAEASREEQSRALDSISGAETLTLRNRQQ